MSVPMAPTCHCGRDEIGHVHTHIPRAVTEVEDGIERADDREEQEN